MRRRWRIAADLRNRRLEVGRENRVVRLIDDPQAMIRFDDALWIADEAVGVPFPDQRLELTFDRAERRAWFQAEGRVRTAKFVTHSGPCTIGDSASAVQRRERTQI